MFPADSFTVTTKVSDIDATKIGTRTFWPAAFWNPLNDLRESGISTMRKHSTVTLTLTNATMDWDGLDFRCVFSYKAPAHEITADSTISNYEPNGRTGHLVVYAPPIELTPLKAQSLLLNSFDSKNGNMAWTTAASNPNNGRRTTDVPLDAIVPDVLHKDGTTTYGAANDNKAVYTTKITFFGNKDSAPTIRWKFSNVAGGGRLDRFMNVTDGDGTIQLNYSQVGKKIGNVNALSNNVDDMERSFMSGNGLAFNKFSAYIKLEAMYPTDAANLNNKTYNEWNAIVSLYIDNATNPMDFGDTHYYFLCEAEERYMKNWDANNMLPYTCGRTVAYNFNRVVDSADPNDHIYKDFSQSSYGAELVLDYTISIKANVPNKATAKHNTITTENGSYKNINDLKSISAINDALNNGGAVYNYKNLAIIAPNGIRYMETYFTAGSPVNSRTTVDSRDTVVIDSSVRDSAGHNWYDLFQQVTASDDDYIGKIGTHGFAYRTKDGNVLDKATWEWWWRNAVYYVCYDAPTDNADMDQVYFYIDEQGSGPKVDDKLEGANSYSNPYSEYTFTYAGTYEVMLYGAGGGSVHGLYTDTEFAGANGICQRIIRVKQIARAVDLYVFVVFQSNSVRTVNLIQRYQIMAYILYLVLRENALCGRGRPCHLIAAIDSAVNVFMLDFYIRNRPGAELVQNLRIVVLDQVVRDVLHTRGFTVVCIAVPQQDGGKILLVDILRVLAVGIIENRSQFLFSGCRLFSGYRLFYVTFCSINRIQIPIKHHTCCKETVSALYGVINTRIQPCTIFIVVTTRLTVCFSTVNSCLVAWLTFRKLQQCRYLLFFKAVFVHKVVAVGHDVFTSTVHRNGCVIGTNRIFIQGKTIRHCGGCTRSIAVATVAADTCKQVGIVCFK